MAETQTRLPSAVSQLPADEQSSFQAALHLARYGVHALTPEERREADRQERGGLSHHASNPAQDLMFGFLENGGLRVQSGRPGKTWQGTLRLAGLARRSRLAEDFEKNGTEQPNVPAAAKEFWTATGTRAERVQGGLTEWYENKTDGLEHGFTLTERPDGADTREGDGKPLVLRLALDGLRASADPRPAPGQEGDLIFSDPVTDQPVLGYRNLKVWDADGKRLDAEMRPSAGGFLIAVNDTAARYPLTVDPLIVPLEQSLQLTGYIRPLAIAVSGAAMVVGEPNTDDARGAVHLFARKPGGWVFETRLRIPSPTSGDYLGAAVAMDGDTIAVGAPGYDADRGTVFLFNRAADNTWTFNRIYAFHNSGDRAGAALAMRGNRLVVGIPGSYSARGKIAVYEITGTSWTGKGELFAPDLPPDANFGLAVALDGALVAAGAPGQSRGYVGNGTGRAFVFRQTGSLWENPVELTAPGLAEGDRFGDAVAVSGSTVAVGAPGRDYSTQSRDIGGVYCFAGADGGWTQTASLMNSSPFAGQGLGTGLAFEDNTLAARGVERLVGMFTRSGNGSWQLTHESLLHPPHSAFYLHNPAIALSGGSVVVPHSSGVETFTLNAGVWSLESRMIFDSGAVNDHFGLSVDVDGDTAVVGALDSDYLNQTSVGMAWAFRRTGSVWSLEALMPRQNVSSGDRFGVAVAVSGDRVVVGADFDDAEGKTDCGSATVFERAGVQWSQAAEFAPAPGGSSFGRSVAIDGNMIIIGAPGVDSSRGKVWSRWKTATDWAGGEITAVTPQAGSLFGFSVAVSGERLIVGSPRSDGAFNTDTGAIHYFRKDAGLASAWAPDGSNGPLQSNACAGFSVALDGSTAVVGSSGPTGWAGGTSDTGRTGKAFVVTHNGSAWSSGFQYLDPAGLAEGAWFGMSVAVENDVIAVGAFGNNTVEGKVRIFRREGTAWVKQTDLRAPGAAEADNAFGVSTALSGGTVLVGAYGADAQEGSDAGMAHVFRISALNPLLSIARAGTDAVLTWPAGTGWTLHRSPSLLPGSWQPVPVVTDGAHNYPLTGAPRMFFRLQRQ